MKKTLLFLLVFIAGLQLSVTAQFDVDENLLLYLSFDEAKLNANEQNVDTTRVTAIAGTGKFGNAATFNGTNYIAMKPIPAYDPHTKSVAFSFWMKTAVQTGEDIFVYGEMEDPTGTDIEGRLAVSLRFDNKLGTDIGWVGGNLEDDPGPNNTAGLVSDGNWHHVVSSFSVKGTSINLYIDNVLVEELTTGGFGEIEPGDSWDFTNFNLFLGMGCSDYPGFELGWSPTFTGALDEFRIFQTAEPLSAADVAVLYNYIPTITAINQTETNSRSVKVYPNPATDLINIQAASRNIDVDIMNAVGQKITSAKNKNQIDISSLAKGVYFVKVNDGTSISIQKVLVK